jgi:fatty acid-binding protein DegV
VDSENITTGQGHLTIEASLMASQGLAPEEICKKISEMAKRVEASLLLTGSIT